MLCGLRDLSFAGSILGSESFAQNRFAAQGRFWGARLKERECCNDDALLLLLCRLPGHRPASLHAAVLVFLDGLKCSFLDPSMSLVSLCHSVSWNGHLYQTGVYSTVI